MIDTTASVDPFKPWPLQVTSATAVVSVRMIPRTARLSPTRTDAYAEPLVVVGPVRSGSLRRFVTTGAP